MKNKKKILIIAPYGFNDRMSNFVEFVSARLLTKNNWQVSAIVMSENTKNCHDQLYNINIFKYKNIINGIFYLLKIFILNRPKIVHVHNLRNNHLGILAGILSKVFFIKLIFTEYGLLHDHYLVTDRDDPFPIKLNPIGLIKNIKDILQKKAPLKYKIKNYLFHWSLTHANKIVFVSRHNIEIAKNLGLKNINYLPQILDNARWEFKKVDINKNIDEQSKEALTKLEQIKDKKYVLFIGQLKLRKGWDIFLKSIPYIDKSVIPYFAIVTSTSNQEPKFFSNLVKELGIDDRLIYFGKIFNSEVLEKIFKQSEIVTVPSRYEGFGLVATEAWEMQKPLVAADVIAINENATNNKDSLLFEVKNEKELAKQLELIINNSELKNRLIQGGNESLKQYKSNQRYNQWLEFYDKVIN